MTARWGRWRVGFGAAAGALVAAACALSVDSSDFARPPPSVGPDASEASAATADAAPASDSGMALEAGDGGPCSSAHALCDDFDDDAGLPGPRWSSTGALTGISVDSVAFVTPPHAAHFGGTSPSGLHRTFLAPLTVIHCELDFRQNQESDAGNYTPIAIMLNVPPSAFIDGGFANYSARYIVGVAQNLWQTIVTQPDGGVHYINQPITRPPFGVWLHLIIDVMFDTHVATINVGEPAPATSTITFGSLPSFRSVDLDFGAIYAGGVFAPSDRDFDDVVCDVR